MTTWADGFGVWHARVPRTTDGVGDFLAAREAIRTELQERAPRGVHVETGAVLRADLSDAATLVYAEEPVCTDASGHRNGTLHRWQDCPYA